MNKSNRKRYCMETIPEWDRELERQRDNRENNSDNTNCGHIHRREWTSNNGYNDYDDEESDGFSLT